MATPHKHYTSLSAWAGDAVDAGHTVSPDLEAPRKEYKAIDKDGKVVGRYSYMNGATGSYETGSLPLREDAGGGGGIGSASVSGAPVSQANFQHFDGPKTQFLKKARKMRRNKAK